VIEPVKPKKEAFMRKIVLSVFLIILCTSQVVLATQGYSKQCIHRLKGIDGGLELMMMEAPHGEISYQFLVEKLFLINHPSGENGFLQLIESMGYLKPSKRENCSHWGIYYGWKKQGEKGGIGDFDHEMICDVHFFQSYDSTYPYEDSPFKKQLQKKESVAAKEMSKIVWQESTGFHAWSNSRPNSWQKTRYESLPWFIEFTNQTAIWQKSIFDYHQLMENHPGTITAFMAEQRVALLRKLLTTMWMKSLLKYPVGILFFVFLIIIRKQKKR
jgi:hypothetical protein